MAGPQSQGLIAQGPLPAGMLRIRQGSQERYVWPVHLPGWLALGWRVAGSGTTAADPLPQALTTAAVDLDSDPERSAIQKEPEPATGRGKRGRRRKEEEPQPITFVAAVEATATDSVTAAEQGHADANSPAATELAAESATELAADSAAAPEASLSGLPDDLLDSPLT